jgi:hypothetical protein
MQTSRDETREKSGQDGAAEAEAKPAYAPPAVTTYTDAALLEALGPARAGGNYNLLGGP